MSSPVVTVIVPARDLADLIDAALASIQAQTTPDWRVILVDDGSRDDTRDIMRRYVDADGRFTLISHDAARGLGAARNAALARVETEFVAFLDGDDEMRPDALRLATTALTASGSDMLVGAYTRLRLIDGEWTRGAVQPWVAASTTPARVGTSLGEHPDVVGNIVAWSKVTRTSLWRRTGVVFPEGVLYEDQAVAQRLYAATHGIDVTPEVLVDWRVRASGDSITQREADPRVLTDCLAQMSAGLDALHAHPAAAARRTTQILRMDVPRLAEIATAQTLPLLAAFVCTLSPTAADLLLPTQSPSNPDDPAAPLVGEVYDRVLSGGTPQRA